MSSRRFRHPTSANALGSVNASGASSSSSSIAPVNSAPIVSQGNNAPSSSSIFVPAAGSVVHPFETSVSQSSGASLFEFSQGPPYNGHAQPQHSVDFGAHSNIPQPETFFGSPFSMKDVPATSMPGPTSEASPAFDAFNAVSQNNASIVPQNFFENSNSFAQQKMDPFFVQPSQPGNAFAPSQVHHNSLPPNAGSASFSSAAPNYQAARDEISQPIIQSNVSFDGKALSGPQYASNAAGESNLRVENFIHDSAFPAAPVRAQQLNTDDHASRQIPPYTANFSSDSESTSISFGSHPFAIKCEKCNRKLDPDANFCSKCGAVISPPVASIVNEKVPASSAVPNDELFAQKSVEISSPYPNPLSAVATAAVALPLATTSVTKKDVFAFRKHCSSCFLFGGRFLATSFSFNSRQTKISLVKQRITSFVASDDIKLIFNSKKSPKDIKAYLTKLLSSNRIICNDLNLIVELILGLVEKDVSFAKFSSVLESNVSADQSTARKSIISPPNTQLQSFVATNATKNLIMSESVDSFVNELMSQNQFALALTVASTMSSGDSFRYCLQYYLDNHTSGPLKYILYSIAGLPFDDAVFNCWKEVALFYLKHPSIPRKDSSSMRDALMKRDPIAAYIVSILFGLWDGSLINLSSCWHDLYFLSLDNWIISEVYDDISTYPPIFGIKYKIWFCKNLLDCGKIDDLNRYLEKNHSLFSAYPDPFLFRLLSSEVLKIKSSASWLKMPKLPSFMDVVEKVIGGEESNIQRGSSPKLDAAVPGVFAKSVIPEPLYTDSSTASLVDDIQQGVLNLSISSQKNFQEERALVTPPPLIGLPGTTGKTSPSPELYHSPAKHSSTDDAPLPLTSSSPFNNAPIAARPVEPLSTTDDEFGFGNPKPKMPNASEDSNKQPAAAPPSPVSSVKSERSATSSQASSKSNYFGFIKGIFKKQPDSTGNTPVVANLEDEDSFVYDENLKRWVNKNSGSDASLNDPYAGGPPSSLCSAAGPTLKPSTDAPVSAKKAADAPPPMASPAFGAAPPMIPLAVPGIVVPSAASSSSGSGPYKNAKSRYVDILAQETKQ